MMKNMIRTIVGIWIGALLCAQGQTTITQLGATDRVDRTVLNANFNNLKASVDATHPSATNPLSHNFSVWSNDIIFIDNLIGIGSGIVTGFSDMFVGTVRVSEIVVGTGTVSAVDASRWNSNYSWYTLAYTNLGYLSSNQTWSGTNTFTKSPLIPAATASNNPVTFTQLKAYSQGTTPFYLTTNKTLAVTNYFTPTNATYLASPVIDTNSGSINISDTGATNSYFFAAVFTNYTVQSLVGGVANIEIWASENSSGTMLFKPEGYLIDTVNSNIYEAAELGEIIEISGTTPTKYEATVPYNDFVTNNPCYLALRLKSTTTANKDVTIYVGNGYSSHFQLSVPLSVLTSDLIKRDGSQPPTGTQDWNGQSLTNASHIHGTNASFGSLSVNTTNVMPYITVVSNLAQSAWMAVGSISNTADTATNWITVLSNSLNVATNAHTVLSNTVTVATNTLVAVSNLAALATNWVVAVSNNTTAITDTYVVTNITYAGTTGTTGKVSRTANNTYALTFPTPFQPEFSNVYSTVEWWAYRSVAYTNGHLAWSNVIFDTVVTNVGGLYNNTDGFATIVTSGVYFAEGNVRFTAGDVTDGLVVSLVRWAPAATTKVDEVYGWASIASVPYGLSANYVGWFDAGDKISVMIYNTDADMDSAIDGGNGAAAPFTIRYKTEFKGRIIR